MSLVRLIFAGLRYYWRTNLAVALAVMAAGAVLTGALLVGDSMRGSLRHLLLDQLGTIDDVLVTDRFFRASWPPIWPRRPSSNNISARQCRQCWCKARSKTRVKADRFAPAAPP